METLASAFKSLLGIRDDTCDEEADRDLEKDVRDYTEILSSSKFANTNSNTEALKRLLRATNEENFVAQNPSQSSQSWIHDPDSKVKTSEDALSSKIDDKDIPKVNHKGVDRFESRLNRHLELIKELEGEYGDILPAEPVFKPKPFGKHDGPKFVLKSYNVPRKILIAMETNSLRPLNFEKTLTVDSYVSHFQTLLWLEEAHQSVEMHRYDMFNVFLAKFGDDSFLLSVPGLAEGRPSLMKGDKLVLKSKQRSSFYEGFITDVRERDVVIRLHHSLRHASTEGLVFDVSFLASRTAFRRCHHGLTTLRLDVLEALVFPKPSNQAKRPAIEVKEKDSQLRCFMRELNIYQRQAVISAIQNLCRPAPYVIFGPPGTGKTVTLVEAALQIYARNPKSKILICANSNACTDLIAHRIFQKSLVPQDQLVRVSAFYRVYNQLIPPEVEPITLQMDEISDEMFRNYRIVITTCIQSGALYEFRERFDFVLIDEAGHANEPESILPMSLRKPGGCSILAGDPHQLGPVCMSPVAKKHGLGQSLLERLFNRVVYQQTEEGGKMYNSSYITKLLISYRADSRVMCINNEMFYNNELKFVVETPKKWLKILKTGNPLTFHPVKGKDRREYTNPSWFNPNEAIRCIFYVNLLYRAGLKPENIGIITPYSRQIEKIYTLFDNVNLPPCKVATMEEYQGDEREIIIISTVRSRTKNLAFDKQFNLGFLFDKKRFNVGISRAKWALIVIGDPEILKKDEHWSKYLERAHHLAELEVNKN